MGKVKEQFLDRLARDPVLRQQWELEEDGRLEPELPEPNPPLDEQDTPSQDGDDLYHPYIFERRSDYVLTSMTEYEVERTRMCRPRSLGFPDQTNHQEV